MVILPLPKMLGQHDKKCIVSHAYVMPGLTDCRQGPPRIRTRGASIERKQENEVGDRVAIQASKTTMSLTQCLIDV